jgi:hypothetical protein
MPKSKPLAAQTPAVATPSAGPSKKNQMVKRNLKPAETTTVDPEADCDFAEHNVLDNMPTILFNL